MNNENSFTRDYRLKPFGWKPSAKPMAERVVTEIPLPETSQQNVNGDMPKAWQLVVGIPAVLFAGWLSIWMGAILLDGCAPYEDSPSPSVARHYGLYSPSLSSGFDDESFYSMPHAITLEAITEGARDE